MNRNIGILVVIAGGALVVLGLLIYSGALSWFGRLPGDIRYEGEHTRVYFPLVSSIVISVVLSVLLYLLRRFF
jgi:membrane protein implicated in regulation of membrane protease activity